MNPIRGGDWYDGGLWENMYQHKWNANDINLYNVWKYLFKVIVLSNQSLSIIDSHQTLLSAEQTRDFTAEVRAVRALFYYYAMDMFGRVPIVTSYDVKLEQVTQSERSEVFKFIVDELQDVAPQLADEHSNKEGNYYGRVTRPVANFLLAKLALNAEIYTDDNWTDGKRQDGKSIYFNVNGEKRTLGKPASGIASNCGKKAMSWRATTHRTLRFIMKIPRRTSSQSHWTRTYI